jgi:hypothetical protein
MLLKMHHSATDGIGGFQLFSKLHSRKREHNPSKPQPDAAPPEWKTPRDVLREQLERDAQQLLGNVRDGAASLFARLQHPVQAVTDAVGFASSLRRVLAEPEAGGSPLLRRRSLSWRFQAFDVLVPDLRAAAKSAGAVAQRRVPRRVARRVPALPREVRPADRDDADRDPDLGAALRRSEGGNKFTGARFAAPVGSPTGRAHEAHGRARARRAQRARARRHVARRAAARALPAPLISQLAGSLTSSNDLQASNVPGFQEDLYMAARRSSASTASARCPAARR